MTSAFASDQYEKIVEVGYLSVGKIVELQDYFEMIENATERRFIQSPLCSFY